MRSVPPNLPRFAVEFFPANAARCKFPRNNERRVKLGTPDNGRSSMLKILAALALLLLPCPILAASSVFAQTETEAPVVTRDGADNAAVYSFNSGWLGLLGLAGLAGRRRRNETTVHVDRSRRCRLGLQLPIALRCPFGGIEGRH
jgi:MYXO-CTERM domain-containing protein